MLADVGRALLDVNEDPKTSGPINFMTSCWVVTTCSPFAQHPPLCRGVVMAVDCGAGPWHCIRHGSRCLETKIKPRRSAAEKEKLNRADRQQKKRN